MKIAGCVSGPMRCVIGGVFANGDNDGALKQAA